MSKKEENKKLRKQLRKMKEQVASMGKQINKLTKSNKRAREKKEKSKSNKRRKGLEGIKTPKEVVKTVAKRYETNLDHLIPPKGRLEEMRNEKKDEKKSKEEKYQIRLVRNRNYMRDYYNEHPEKRKPPPKGFESWREFHENKQKILNSMY